MNIFKTFIYYKSQQIVPLYLFKIKALKTTNGYDFILHNLLSNCNAAYFEVTNDLSQVTDKLYHIMI